MVFFYTPFYPPQSQAAATRCFWLIKTLRDSGKPVRVLTSVKTNESEKLCFNPADNKQSTLKRLIFEVLAGIELFLRILRSQEELYVLSSPPFLTIFIGHLACRLKKVPYLIDVRDIYPDVYFAQGLLKENSFIGRRVIRATKKMYERSKGIFSVTPGLVEKIKLLAPKARVELLINGVDTELFRPSTQKYEKFTVIFHGNMGKIQHIPTILKVAEQLVHHEEIEFVFIGEGPQSKIIQECRLKNVRYLGPRNYKEIPVLISKAHIGFSARRDDEIGSDAFPVKVFEYLGVGIPVILTPRSGIMTKLVPEGLYEFGNDEIESIARKILELKEKGSPVTSSQQFSRKEISKKILSFCDLN